MTQEHFERLKKEAEKIGATLYFIPGLMVDYDIPHKEAVLAAAPKTSKENWVYTLDECIYPQKTGKVKEDIILLTYNLDGETSHRSEEGKIITSGPTTVSREGAFTVVEQSFEIRDDSSVPTPGETIQWARQFGLKRSLPHVPLAIATTFPKFNEMIVPNAKETLCGIVETSTFNNVAVCAVVWDRKEERKACMAFRVSGDRAQGVIFWHIFIC